MGRKWGADPLDPPKSAHVYLFHRIKNILLPTYIHIVANRCERPCIVNDSSYCITVFHYSIVYSKLLSLLQVADMTTMLKNIHGNFTVFAPTNDAFEAMESAYLDRLLTSPVQLGKVGCQCPSNMAWGSGGGISVLTELKICGLGFPCQHSMRMNWKP